MAWLPCLSVPRSTGELYLEYTGTFSFLEWIMNTDTNAMRLYVEIAGEDWGRREKARRRRRRMGFLFFCWGMGWVFWGFSFWGVEGRMAKAGR